MDLSVFEKKVWESLFKLNLPDHEKNAALQVLCGHSPCGTHLTSCGDTIEITVSGEVIIKSGSGEME